MLWCGVRTRPIVTQLGSAPVSVSMKCKRHCTISLWIYLPVSVLSVGVGVGQCEHTRLATNVQFKFKVQYLPAKSANSTTVGNTGGCVFCK